MPTDHHSPLEIVINQGWGNTQAQSNHYRNAGRKIEDGYGYGERF